MTVSEKNAIGATRGYLKWSRFRLHLIHSPVDDDPGKLHSIPIPAALGIVRGRPGCDKCFAAAQQPVSNLQHAAFRSLDVDFGQTDVPVLFLGSRDLDLR